MKKQFFLASALLSVLLLTTPVMAETSSHKSTTEQTKDASPRLSEEHYKIVKDAMNKVREDNKHLNDQIKAKKKELAAIMSADKFDKAAYLAKHNEIQNLIEKASYNRASAMADAAEKLPASDRKILAERIGKRKGNRSGYHGQGKQGGDYMKTP